MALWKAGFAALVVLSATPVLAAEPSGDVLGRDFTAQIRPLLTKHCDKCHGATMKEGGVEFASIGKSEQALARGRLWKRAAKRIARGDMPPEGEKPLAKEDRDRLLAWLKTAGDYVDCDPRRIDPGPTGLRRLTRTEYNRTIRDLLQINFDAGNAAGLPEDVNAEGYDNLSATLTLSTSLMEKYFTAADKVVEHVFSGGPQNRKAVFTVQPGKDLAEREAARKIIIRLAHRAFRRPPQPADVDRFLGFYDRATARGENFEAGVRAMLKPLLVSPQFLFRIEQDRKANGEERGANVDDHELAVRLSYFLWSTMPDDALLAVADRGKLSDGAVLEAQVRRMLADRKAHALTENFAVQWLQLKKLRNARPSQEFFPTFNNRLKDAMFQETVTFVDKLREEDRSILDLLDADYTFVNDVLAQHYGIADVKGPEMRRVALKPEHHRGGLLGMASVLTLTSHTFRTSPTQRGKYILEVVFGTPPPPPPPNVGMIKDDKPGKKKDVTTFREQLAQHATQASCAGCHRKIDPLGFALDNFNAIGAWRESTKEQPLDVSGVLPNGEKINGVADLKKVMKERQAEFTRNLGEQMLIYALGRELDHYDECTIRDVVATAQKHDHRFSSLVLGIVKSVPFRQRRAVEK